MIYETLDYTPRYMLSTLFGDDLYIYTRCFLIGANLYKMFSHWCKFLVLRNNFILSK